MIPCVPKQLKHSNSEHVSRLPEISSLKLRKTTQMLDSRLMPDAQLRNLTCRTNSMKKAMQAGMSSVMTPSAKHTTMKALQQQRQSAISSAD